MFVFTQVVDCMHALLIRQGEALKFRFHTCHEEPTLCDFLTRKYWINLSDACGTCLDIYLSGGERIYSWIY